jgi:uncharacterized protein involved in type VI secretion and phage assembly
MANRQYKNDSYKSIYYKIWIDNIALSPFEHSLVEEVVFEDTSTGSDMVSITVIDPDRTLIDNPKIMKSTPCRVDGGYITDYRTWINGYISAVDVDFPEEGSPVMTIHIMDRSYIMNRVERKKVYKNMTYGAIAKKIATSYGLSYSGDTSGDGNKKHESVTQSYETDIQFLIGLASEIGYLVYVDSANNRLYFKDKSKFSDKNASNTLWYKHHPFDIISFRPRVIQADQLDEVEQSDIDNKTKSQTGSKATSKNGNNTGGGATSGGSKGGTGNGNTSGSTSGGEMVYDPYTGTWKPA